MIVYLLLTKSVFMFPSNFLAFMEFYYFFHDL